MVEAQFRSARASLFIAILRKPHGCSAGLIEGKHLRISAPPPRGETPMPPHETTRHDGPSEISSGHADAPSPVAVPRGGIRPVERSDLPKAVSLYESLMRSGSQVPPIHLREYFERTLLDHPWADPAIPSLIFVDADGEILGFIGSHVRRF